MKVSAIAESPRTANLQVNDPWILSELVYGSVLGGPHPRRYVSKIYIVNRKRSYFKVLPREFSTPSDQSSGFGKDAPFLCLSRLASHSF